MALRSKVDKLEGIARTAQSSTFRKNFTRRFQEAHEKGMVLCRDGKERPFEEWLSSKGIDSSYLQDENAQDEA